MKALELREKAGRSHAEGVRLMESFGGADKMTAEQKGQVDAHFDECERLLGQAETLEKRDRLAANHNPEPRQTAGENPAGEESRELGPRGTKEYREAFVSYLRRGNNLPAEQRATLIADLDTGGGFIAGSRQFIDRLMQAVDDMLPLMGLVSNYPVGIKDSLGVPYLASDLSEFEFGAGEETEAAEDTGLAFGLRELKPRDLKRKLVKVSKALIQSALLDVEGLVAQRIAYALAKTFERAMLTGTGDGQPLGLFTASTNGIATTRDVSTGNNATGLTGDGLINAQGTLKEQYQSNARWLFHRDTVTQIRKLKDGMGQYLWQPGIQGGAPSVILTKPYTVSELAPNTLTTGQYVGIYGDFKFYWLATALGGMAIQRLVEMYARAGKIGLLVDGIGVDGMPMMGEAFVRCKLG